MRCKGVIKYMYLLIYVPSDILHLVNFLINRRYKNGQIKK